MLRQNEVGFVPPITSNVTMTLDASLKALLERFVVMQYTGLRDKNHKEIYEGDIIKSKLDNIGKVIWKDSMAAFYIIFKQGNDLLEGWNRDGEVIGNIYENPELLTG
jgi:hypothetical protein